MSRKSLARLMAEAAWRKVRRHKVISSAATVFAAAAIAVSVVTTSSPAAPTAAPGFSLAALGNSGQKVSLSQYAGRPVVINFWASWCEPCQQETPLLAKWYKEQDGHVALIGLDENDAPESGGLRFARAKGITYPVGYDPQTLAAGSYDVSALPQTFFLNARHQIVDHVAGALTAADLARGLGLMRPSS